MKIKLEKNIYLESDSRQYMLKKYKKTKDKETGETKYFVSDTTYHPTIAQVVRSMLNRKVRDSTAATLKEMMDEYTRIEKEMLEICKNLKNSEVLRDRT